jgi:hypothetical protein
MDMGGTVAAERVAEAIDGALAGVSPLGTNANFESEGSFI